MNGHTTDTLHKGLTQQSLRRMQRVLLLAILLAGAFIGFSPLVKPIFADKYSEAAQEPIARVLVRGNQTIRTSDIARHIKTRPGQPLNDKTRLQIRQDIDSLYATRWFVSVEKRVHESKDGLVLVYQVHERPIVRKVSYLGNKKLKDKKLASITNIKSGSPLDISINRDAARRLQQEYYDRGYLDATVELETGDNKGDREVVFRIKEGNKITIKGVRFFGNEAFSTSLLKTKVTLKPYVPYLIGKTFDPATIPDEVTVLRNYYHALGYFDVDIEYKLAFSENRKHAYIEYHIVEGPLYKIGKVEFIGNEIFKNDVLRSDVKLTSGMDFNLLTLNKDITKVNDRYYELGHFFATVEAAPRFLEKAGVVDLVYRIDEDRPRIVRYMNVHLRGDNPHTKKAVVRNYMRLHPGDLANRRMIQRSKSRLEGVQLFERPGPGVEGVEINVTPVTPVSATAGKFRGQNPSVVPRENSYSGNSYPGSNPFRVSSNQPLTKREKLRRTLAGESFPSRKTTHTNASSRHAVSQHGAAKANGDGETTNLTSNFENSPFLESGSEDPWFVPRGLMLQEAMRTPVVRGQNYEGGIPQPGSPLYGNNPQGDPFGQTPGALPPGFVDVDVYASEARTGRIMFGVGVNSDAGVVGSIVLSEQNFDIRRPPRNFQEIIDGTAWRGGGQRFRAEAVPGSEVSRYMVSWTDPFFANTDYSLSLSGFYFTRFYEDWDEQRGGGRIQVGRQLTNEISVSGGFRIESVDVTDVEVPTPADLAKVEGSNLLTTLLVSIAHDTRDAPFLTGEGHLLSLSYEQGVGEFNFPKVTAEAKQYFTVFSRPDGGGRHILALSGQAGWTGSDTPLFERYWAGGFQTFRGFEFRGVTPRELGVRVGGEFMALASAEYMFPLMANETFQGVVFSDMGTVEDKIGFDSFRLSVGAGLRVTVPAMGPVPLAFDFAVPLIKEDFDDEQVFSFYIGVTR